MRSEKRRLRGGIRRTFLAGGDSGASRTFRPWIEPLEDRRMLACEVLFRDGALVVLGDEADNGVEITVGLGRVQVACDGIDYGTFDQVQSIRVELNAGNDGLKFAAEEALGPEGIKDTDGDGIPEIVDGFGGAGADTFVIDASAAALLRLDGGEDGDTVEIQFGRLFGAVQVSDRGGEGQDVLRAIGTSLADKIDVDGDEQALVVKWEGPRLNGSGGTEVAIETLEIAHEGFDVAEVKGGDGDDALRVFGSPPLPLRLFGQDGNDLGSWSKVDGLSVEWDVVEYDGGQGHDAFQVTTTNQDELIEIDGIASREVPDPLIRVTDLATQKLAAELSIVGTEAISVDSAAGDDSVAVSDAGGSLAEIAWSIHTGEGNDAVRVALTAGDGLHRFNLDAGAGRDQLLFTLPAAHAGIDIHAALIHSGLVDLQLEHAPSSAEGPITAARFAITIDGYEIASFSELSGITSEVNTIDFVESPEKETIAASLGARDDVLVLALSGQSRVPIELAVDSGAGNDRIDVRSRSQFGPLDLLLAIDPGTSRRVLQDAGDEVLVTFEHGDIDRPVIIGTIWNSSTSPRSRDQGGRLSLHAAAGAEQVLFDLDLVGSAGDDVVRVNASSAQEPLDPADGIIYVLDISGSMGGGNDSFTYSGLSGPPVRTGAWILDTTLDVNMGPGNDQVAVLLETPAEEANQKMRIDTGDGADGVTVLLRRLANPHLPPSAEDPPNLDQLEIFTGAGNDTIDVMLESAAAAVAQKVRIDSGAGHDRVSVNAADARRDGLADLIVGADAGAGPHVKVIDGASSAQVQSFDPYGPSFSGGVRVATGDVNGDGVADIITGAGPGAGPHVKVFDGTSGAEIRSFFAYGASFSGGIHVAAGDVNGDGLADIITGAGAGAPGGHVKVFDGRTGAEVRSFFAFDGFAGGVTVAAGDVNGDGGSDIIVGAGPGAPGGHVKVFDGRTGAPLQSFLAFPGFSGGVFVAAGDLDGDGASDIVTGAGAGAPGGHVKAFSGATGAELRSFFAFDSSFAGGVRVAAGDVNGDGIADIVTGAGPGAPGGHVKVFDGTTGAEIRSLFAFDPNFNGGVFVAAGDLNHSALPRRLDLELAIDTAGGADQVAVQLGAAATEEVLQKVRIATGDGADRAHVIWNKLQLKAEFPSVAAELDLDMGGGNDDAQIELSPDIGPDNIYSFKLQLGDGNDVARYWIFGTELPLAAEREPIDHEAGKLDLRVLGGQGSDDIRGHIGSDPSGRLLPLALGQVSIEIDGGAGRDRLSLDFHGPLLDGDAVDAVLRGGGGNDQVRARFDLLPPSTGQLSVQVLGDAGNDELELAIVGEEELDAFFALLDGGKGRDKCRVTKNVTLLNCER